MCRHTRSDTVEMLRVWYVGAVDRDVFHESDHVEVAMSPGIC